jgi:hypothetical protein
MLAMFFLHVHERARAREDVLHALAVFLDAALGGASARTRRADSSSSRRPETLELGERDESCAPACMISAIACSFVDADDVS